MSEPGNLYATLALRDPAHVPALGTLSLVAAVAVRRALVAATGAEGFQLKWPNDVLLGGAKVAGILLEAFDAGGARWATVGCGVNCTHHPSDTPYAATDLRAAGLASGVEPLFAALEHEMAVAIAAWDRGRDFAPLRDEWLANAHGMDAPATVRAPGRTVEGTARGLAPDGRLLLETAEGMEAIAAGDLVSHAAHGGAVHE